MHRRQLLRAFAAFGAGTLAVSCGPSSRGSSGSGSQSSASSFDPVELVAPDAEESLSVVSGSFEQLTGNHPLAFGVYRQTTEGAQPLGGEPLELYVVGEAGEISPPLPASYHEVPGNPLGAYVADVQLEEPGVTSFVAVTADGERAGVDTLQVVRPEQSTLPAPDQEAIVVATPTARRPLNYEKLCTREPNCGMHEVSLDQALRQKRPVALLFATPAYCQTAICGPVVDILEQVRTGDNWGRRAFIHVEIYADQGQNVGKPVEQWQLPSEPWLFAIDRSGMIQARADGPLLTLPDHVTAMLDASIA